MIQKPFKKNSSLAPMNLSPRKRKFSEKSEARARDTLITQPLMANWSPRSPMEHIKPMSEFQEDAKKFL